MSMVSWNPRVELKNGETVEVPAVVRGHGGAFVFIDDQMHTTITAALTHYFDNGPRHRRNAEVLRAMRRLNDDYRKAGL